MEKEATYLELLGLQTQTDLEGVVQGIHPVSSVEFSSWVLK